jgi:hypothetical protein
MREVSRWPRTRQYRIGVPLRCEGIVQPKVDRKMSDTAVKARGSVKETIRQHVRLLIKGHIQRC